MMSLDTMADTGEVACDTSVLREIEQRVLWLAPRMVDAANRDRATGDGVKVGGHQASSASLVTSPGCGRAVVCSPTRRAPKIPIESISRRARWDLGLRPLSSPR